MNILISGMTCSGKTTLANYIQDNYSGVSIIREDDYFKDMYEIPHTKDYYLLDSTNAFHTSEFKKDALTFLEDKSVMVPIYDVKSNKRLSKDRIVYSNKINIFEGLHTISLLGNIDAVKVFLDTDIETCLYRRINRDVSAGFNEEEIRDYFDKVIVPIYKAYIEPQKEYANVIIKKDGDKKCLLKMLEKF